MTWRRRPTRVTKHQVRRSLAGLEALAKGNLAPLQEMKAQAPRKRGRQPESKVGEANRETARLLGGVLYRNRRGMLPLPGGGMIPVGLGPNGFPDECGYLTIKVTPDMVGRRIAVAWFVEDKTDSGVIAPHQLALIEELRDAGAITGVSRGPDELRAMVQRWREGK